MSSADEIQSQIEQARAALADAVDQLTYRTNPKRVIEKTKASLVAKAQSDQGRIVIGVVGGVIVLVIVRKIFKRK